MITLPPSLPSFLSFFLQTYYKAENEDGRMPLGKRPGGDARVDVCLYFLAAHRLKWIDIKFMQVRREGGRKGGMDNWLVSGSVRVLLGGPQAEEH
jgi:hypothetical protein